MRCIESTPDYAARDTYHTDLHGVCFNFHGLLGAQARSAKYTLTVGTMP